MTATDAAKSFLGSVIHLEVSKLIPMAIHAIPGIAGVLLDEVWQQPEVQAKVTELETKGVDWALMELAKGMGDIEQLAISHTKGRMQQLLGDALGTVKTAADSVTLNADQVALIAPLIERGQLEAALKAGAAALGVPL